MNRKRILVTALLLALVAAVVAIPGIQLAGGPTERLTNGDFESGFTSTPEGYAVGSGWSWFDNGGSVQVGFYDETWSPVIYDGDHAQLIELNTYNLGGSEADRYAGIYQTVAVVPGETYELTLHGMLRAVEDDPDRTNYSYRLQYGVDDAGGTDWTAVDNWVEVPWDTVYPRLSPGSLDSYSASITAASPRLTLFIRAWKKWGTIQRELDVDLDAISLKGAMPSAPTPPSVSFTVPSFPVAGWSYAIPVVGSSGVGVTKLEFYDGTELVGSTSQAVGLLTLTYHFTWTPATSGNHKLKAVVYDAAGDSKSHTITVAVGAEKQFLANGDFEGGFYMGPNGEVGLGWGWFNNGGQATYGYYDETWAPAVSDGEHSQLIEINTFRRAGSDPDRYSGIYQTVTGLKVGATYQLALSGMLRARAEDPDLEGTNYRVEWGYDPAGGTDWAAVDNWTEIPWNAYDRLNPGDMGSYAASFEAPSSQITIFIRAWKKWGTVDRELDVNLDSIALKGLK
jgi:hypothetical protein